MSTSGSSGSSGSSQSNDENKENKEPGTGVNVTHPSSGWDWNGVALGNFESTK
jgi:hypothetical protein